MAEKALLRAGKYIDAENELMMKGSAIDSFLLSSNQLVYLEVY
ncbi:hypothetical protein [Thalassotalea ganghwensis]